jgi:hypothetical protein
MQQTACIEQQNEVNARKLGGNWRGQLDKFAGECLKEWPGGGSGGRIDRAICVEEKIKKVAKN